MPRIVGYPAICRAAAPSETPGERLTFLPGCFVAASVARCVANIDHDPARPFASVADGSLRVWSDDVGLRCEILPWRNQVADAVLTHFRSGGSWQMSCKYVYDSAERIVIGGVPYLAVRRVTELLDVCLTRSPRFRETAALLIDDQPFTIARNARCLTTR